MALTTNKRHAKRVLWACAAGVAVVVAFAVTPFAIPCLFRLVTGIPCPGCGLSRAFVYALRLDFLAAMRMNFLFLPLVLIGGTYFVCAVLELCGKASIAWFNKQLSRWWMIALAAALMLSAWGQNIYRGI